MTDLSMRSRSQTLETSTNDIAHLRRTVQELFEKFLEESDLEIRRVGVKISHFSTEQASQKQLTSFFQNN
jgi:nucleotidyltransferase/DNA polymerase involved in DNA repair